jgi:hypothetical protein
MVIIGKKEEEKEKKKKHTLVHSLSRGTHTDVYRHAHTISILNTEHIELSI